MPEIKNEVKVSYSKEDIENLIKKDAERTVGSHKAVSVYIRITTKYDPDDWRGERPYDDVEEAVVTMEQK